MQADPSFVEALKAQYCSDAFTRYCSPIHTSLGIHCTPEFTIFRLWSPLAHAVTLLLYRDGRDSPLLRAVSMEKSADGIWWTEVRGDLHGLYYLYEIDHGGEQVLTGDPYAIACGVNSQRCMVVNLDRTNPPQWDQDRAPAIPPESVLYELHVKEFSWQKQAGFPEACRGTYKAFTCENTTLNHAGLHPTGLSYLKALGVTHVQLMPVYDFGSVDDTDPAQFNWGYDPVYDNIPEGSYASDPFDGTVRIRELKEAIQALHRQGFRVIMDVVYNHTYSLDSAFNRTVPWYYYRTVNGLPANGSGCGNEFASEMPMAGQFILDSVLYWAREYHMDGFRFDLMGLLDVGLLNRIRSKLDSLYGPGEKLLLGEPWAAGTPAMLPGAIPALKENASALAPGIAMFSDTIRDTIRGSVFDETSAGFAGGQSGLEPSMLQCVRAGGTSVPAQVISYLSCHDNHTLWDKLSFSMPEEDTRLRANQLAAACLFACQGYPFLLSGEEFGRTKNLHPNTYNEPISLNRLDWERTCSFAPLVAYYRGLIALRKRCPGLCDKTAAAASRIHPAESPEGLVLFTVENQPSPWNVLCIALNQTQEAGSISLAPGSWQILVDGTDSFLWKNHTEILTGSAELAPCSALFLGLLPADEKR